MHALMTAPMLDATRLDVLADLEDDTSDLLSEVVGLFVTDTDRSLAAATEAAGVANMGVLRRIAHDLKGTCGTIGAVRMQALATELEDAVRVGEAQDAGHDVQRLVEEFAHVRALLDQYTRARIRNPRAESRLAL